MKQRKIEPISTTVNTIAIKISLVFIVLSVIAGVGVYWLGLFHNFSTTVKIVYFSVVAVSIIILIASLYEKNEDEEFNLGLAAGLYSDKQIKLAKPKVSLGLSSKNLDIKVFGVLNNQINTRTGTLRLRIWGTKNLSQNGEVSGYVLATHRLDTLDSNSMFERVSKTIEATRPPDGWYYVVMTLEEWNDGKWLTVDYANIVNGEIYLQIKFYHVTYKPIDTSWLNTSSGNSSANDNDGKGQFGDCYQARFGNCYENRFGNCYEARFGNCYENRFGNCYL